MGKYDSTRTRVTPVFDHLAASETSWLEPLLSLPSAGHQEPLPWAERSMLVDELRYGQSEKPLPAPGKLLEWLTRNARDVSEEGLVGLSAHSAQKRRLLLERNPRSSPKRTRCWLQAEATTSGSSWKVQVTPTYSSARRT